MEMGYLRYGIGTGNESSLYSLSSVPSASAVAFEEGSSVIMSTIKSWRSKMDEEIKCGTYLQFLILLRDLRGIMAVSNRNRKRS
jgi:hypothetical protein